MNKLFYPGLPPSLKLQDWEAEKLNFIKSILLSFRKKFSFFFDTFYIHSVCLFFFLIK